MNKLGLSAGLAIAVLLPTAAMAAGQHVISLPDSLKWAAAPAKPPRDPPEDADHERSDRHQQEDDRTSRYQ